MEYRFGKPLDPQSFKSHPLEDLSDAADDYLKKASTFRERTNLVDVESCYICDATFRERVFEIFGYEYARCKSLRARLSHAATL